MAGFFRYTLLFSFCILYAPHGFADFITLIRADQCETIIEYFIEDNGIRVNLEIGPNDFPAFRDIVPEELEGGILNAETKMQQLDFFVSHIFKIKVDGIILGAVLQKMEIRDRVLRTSLYTGKVDSTILLSDKIWFVELFFPLKNAPGQIILGPPDYPNSTFIPNIGFVCYHKGIPVNDLRYLTAEATLTLDWGDPWYSTFNHPNLRRHHQSSMMSYLYVEPYEVRHEVLIRIKDLEEWISLDYSLADDIPVEDFDSLRVRIGTFMAANNPIYIDGVKSEPFVDKVHFLNVSLSGIQIINEPMPIPYSSSIIGVILSYAHDSLPREVTVHWNLFNELIQEVPSVATDPAGPLPYLLRPSDSVMVWTNYLKTYKIPTITSVTTQNESIEIEFLFIGLIVLLVLGLRGFVARSIKNNRLTLLVILIFVAGGFISIRQLNIGIPIPGFTKSSFSEPEAKLMVSQMLKNIYRAFDYSDEEVIYDKLATSVHGDLLTNIYLEAKRSMILENQGGIQVKVDDIKVDTLFKVGKKSSSIFYECKWLTAGEVGHWGHKHRRQNLYHANIKIEPFGKTWKISELNVIEESRVY